MTRLLLILTLLLSLSACGPEPRPRPRPKQKIEAEQPKATVSTKTWQAADTELETGVLYEARFEWNAKALEWWPAKALPKARHQAARLDFTNIIDFPVLKTKNRTPMRITFTVLSKDLKPVAGQKRVNVTYYTRLVTVERIR